MNLNNNEVAKNRYKHNFLSNQSTILKILSYPPCLNSIPNHSITPFSQTFVAYIYPIMSGSFSKYTQGDEYLMNF